MTESEQLAEREAIKKAMPELTFDQKLQLIRATTEAAREAIRNESTLSLGFILFRRVECQIQSIDRLAFEYPDGSSVELSGTSPLAIASSLAQATHLA